MKAAKLALVGTCLVLAHGACADAVNDLAPYDNAQNTAFWNTTERAMSVTSVTPSSNAVALNGAGRDAKPLAIAFDSRPGSVAASAARSLLTTKAKGFLLNLR